LARRIAEATNSTPWDVLRKIADYMEWHDMNDCPGHDLMQTMCDPKEAA